MAEHIRIEVHTVEETEGGLEITSLSFLHVYKLERWHGATPSTTEIRRGADDLVRQHIVGITDMIEQALTRLTYLQPELPFP